MLTIASLIPGVDTIADLASIPVDLIRGDYISAGLSAIGAIPVVGEIADTAKLAKTADKIIDTAKAAGKAADAASIAKKTTHFSDFPKNIHMGKQGKHIVGHNNYVIGKSIFNGTTDDASKLMRKFSGTGMKKGTNKELVDFGQDIGKYIDPNTGKSYGTTMGTIHYSKNGAHIVPARPKIRK